jgi:hypothetical protein
MNRFSSVPAVLALLVSFNAFAATHVVATQDLRGDSRYYVRWNQLTPQAMLAIGLSEAPGTGDDEGYCQISGFYPGTGFMTANLQAGDVLEPVSEKGWTRKEYDYHTNSVIDIQDSMSVLKRKSDGVQFYLSCSIDASASERAPYKGIGDTMTKAYLTVLGLFIRQ